MDTRRHPLTKQVHTFSTCSLYWSACRRSSSSCITSSFSFLSCLRFIFCWANLSLQHHKCPLLTAQWQYILYFVHPP